jgi:hypothetical protein
MSLIDKDVLNHSSLASFMGQPRAAVPTFFETVS